MMLIHFLILFVVFYILLCTLITILAAKCKNVRNSNICLLSVYQHERSNEATCGACHGSEMLDSKMMHLFKYLFA